MGRIDARGRVGSHAGQVSWRGMVRLGGMTLKDKMPMKMANVAVWVAMAVLMMMMEACRRGGEDCSPSSFLSNLTSQRLLAAFHVCFAGGDHSRDGDSTVGGCGGYGPRGGHIEDRSMDR